MNRQCKRNIRRAIVLGVTAVLVLTTAKVIPIKAQEAESDSATPISNAAAADVNTFWARWSSVDWQAMTPSVTSGLQLLPAPSVQTAPEATVVFGQNVFNNDPTVLSQNDTTVVFDPSNSNRVVGAYQDGRGFLLSSTTLGGDSTGWSISTNGASPAKDGQLQPATIAGTKTPSAGFPVLTVDAAGDFFLASVYYDWEHAQLSHLPTGPSGVAIARSPKAGSTQGVFSTACTGGDANLNCWPTLKVIAAETCTTSGGHFHDKPYIAIDKSGSVAKGSVYMVWAKIGCGDTSQGSAILAVKCANDLSSCTAPVTLASAAAGSDFLELPHLAVSPGTGKVYVTWDHYSGTSLKTDTDTIQMQVIAPSASPSSVGTLGPLRTVVSETQPVPFYTFPYPAVFRTATYPKVAIKGTRAIVVWERRTTTNFLFNTWYFDSDILGRFTDDDGATFSANQAVSTGPSFQYMPTICVDPVSNRVVVAYYSTQNDQIAKHRQDIYVATSPTGASPYTPLRVTPVSNVSEAAPQGGDTYIGDKIEAACGPDFAYIHYTANYALKNIAPFDTPSLLIPQRDNFLAKVTLP